MLQTSAPQIMLAEPCGILQDDIEDDELDKPLFVDPFLSKLKGFVQDVCSKADLNSLTLRMVREQLEKDHGVDVTKHKVHTRQGVTIISMPPGSLLS